MKTIYLIFLMALSMLLQLSCEEKNGTYIAPCGKIIAFTACGINDIGNNLPWLKDIIESSENDQTGNYIGRIWFKRYNNQDLIITDMSLGSGGLAYHVFNCLGQNLEIGDINLFTSLTEQDIIWTKICID